MNNISENESELLEILQINVDKIFCPNCGLENFPKNEPTTNTTVYFCKRCNLKLNDFWEKYDNKKLKLMTCKSCEKKTFRMQGYCINCGTFIIKSKLGSKLRVRYSGIDADLVKQIIGTIFGISSIASNFLYLINPFLVFLNLPIAIVGLFISKPPTIKNMRFGDGFGFIFSIFVVIIEVVLNSVILILFLMTYVPPY
ncbi:MAG: hypothetical protein ACTSO7_09415 [Candidatus Heimdallarchaeota archaeon]